MTELLGWWSRGPDQVQEITLKRAFGYSILRAGPPRALDLWGTCLLQEKCAIM